MCSNNANVMKLAITERRVRAEKLPALYSSKHSASYGPLKLLAMLLLPH